MKTVVGKIAVIGAFVAAALAPAAASATDYEWIAFNDGQGNCGYMSCGAYGCVVVERHNCPNEVSGG